MDAHFNFQRFFLVLKRDLLENGRSALFGLLTVISIFSFILLMTTFDTNQIILNQFNKHMFFIAFYILAVFYSGMAFSDFRNKEKTMSYLMLPASSLEKFLSILLLSTIGFIISFIVVFGLFNILNMGIISSFSGDLSLDFYNPINRNLLTNIAIILPIQSVFLVGAVKFQRLPIFYTALYFFLFLLIYGFLSTIVLKFYTGSMSFDGLGDNNSFRFQYSDGSFGEKTIGQVLSVQSFIFFVKYLLAPIFWVVAWFKLKEKEV